MFFPPSGVLRFDVAFVAFGDEEALSGPPRDSRLSRRMQSYSSSSNTHTKKKMELHRCFNITQPVLEPCRPAQRSRSSSSSSFLISAVSVFPLPVSSSSGWRAPVSPHLVCFVRSVPLRPALRKPSEGQEDGRRSVHACLNFLTFRHFNGAPTSSLCRISKH